MTAHNDSSQITAVVKNCAHEFGFDLVRITSADEFPEDREIAIQRIEDGLMDGLPWFNAARVNRGSSPRQLLPGARSVICLALNYFPGPPGQAKGKGEDSVPQGKIARYARGRDYHRVMKRKMRDCVVELSCRLDTKVAARWYVDDGPMLDRAAAARSGLGWFGKNTNILTSTLGSWVFLGQIVTDLELEPDPPLAKTCGSCARCIDACPTGAIVAPYVIDNARCISYLTIENRGPIPRELRPQMLDWVFGCDICQEVCPVNRKEQLADEPHFARRDMSVADLVELLGMTDESFSNRFAGTPVMRARRVGMQRNACVALGNARDPSTVPALIRVLVTAEAVVRGHAAWALGEIGGAAAHAALGEALDSENDPDVFSEITEALKNLEERASTAVCTTGVPE